MKETFFSIFLSCAFSVAFAQFDWGIKAGANASGVRLQDVRIAYNVLPGYNLGLFAEKNMTRRLGILTELNFSTQGTSLSDGRHFHLNYFSIPVLATYTIDKHWQALFGPEVGYLAKAYLYTPGYKDQDYKYYFHSYEWGLAGGIRYRFANRWGFDLRYLFGINEIQRPPYSQYAGDVIVLPPYNPRNTVLQGDVFFTIR